MASHWFRSKYDTIMRLHAAQVLKRVTGQGNSSREILFNLSQDPKTETHIRYQVAQELRDFGREEKEEAIRIFTSIGLDQEAPITLRIKILEDHLTKSVRFVDGTRHITYPEEALDIFESIGLDQKVSSSTRDWCAQEVLKFGKTDKAAQIWHSIGLSPKNDEYTRTHPAFRLMKLSKEYSNPTYEAHAAEIWYFIGLDPTATLSDKKRCIEGLCNLNKPEHQRQANEILQTVPADQRKSMFYP